MSQGSGSSLIAGKYEILRLLAEGGMGSVYEGRNTTTLKRCALKLLTIPGLEHHPELVQRFFLEARATSVLESDHIVQTFDSGVDNQSGRPYIIMEFLRGEDLKVVLARTGALEPRSAAKLVLQAATGLAKAHEGGILHRDIKPANLFLTRRDSGHVCVKILDFGIAKVKVENELLAPENLTQTGGLLGTPLYMSPEQVRGASNVDARSDVWSLGVVLYECLAGDTPFAERGSVGELMSSILNSLPRNLQDIAPWVPAEFAAIAHRALARDPAHRFANAAQMRDAIGQLLLGDTELRDPDVVAVSSADRTHISPRLVPLQSEPSRARRAAEVSVPPVALASEQPIALAKSLDAPELATMAESGAHLAGSTLMPAHADPTTTQADRSRVRRAGGIALVTLAGGAALVVSLRAGNGQQGPHTTTSTNTPSVALAAAPVPALPQVSAGGPPAVSAVPAAELEFLLGVPARAEVTVDGRRVEVEESRVRLRGTPGSTRLVEIRQGVKRELVRVAITIDGPLPPSLDFRGKAGAAAAKLALPVSTATPKATATPEAPRVEPVQAKAPLLNESTNEFSVGGRAGGTR